MFQEVVEALQSGVNTVGNTIRCLKKIDGAFNSPSVFSGILSFLSFAFFYYVFAFNYL